MKNKSSSNIHRTWINNKNSKTNRVRSNRSNKNKIAKWKVNQNDRILKSSKMIKIWEQPEITIRLNERIGKKWIPKRM
ncbi:unnamed protein product (macronuclear) [Paramecium tetraurelia]|uniref:Uncharacterized protein n=1 Tax=Paramecium tetraurelia TaxID=5888 RepID=A0CGP4_PARTE|nr:uncharacterized protein GSPATT00007401001 [Paramecium tetraurelia]CAK69961.1 unnamed protein product [Paramecium tetraurelia]|eukprot:XP_001437358.1 hypothetical protein (macronuclear) [Paramecium tetraurelia strain d4-2]